MFYKINTLQQHYEVGSAAVSLLWVRKPICPMIRVKQGKLPPKKELLVIKIDYYSLCHLSRLALLNQG